jgi:hypothetical protein
VKSINENIHGWMFVCSIFGVFLLIQSSNMMYDASIITQTLSLAITGLALLIIIYGFSPSTTKAVINAIVQIVSIPLKALFS